MNLEIYSNLSKIMNKLKKKNTQCQYFLFTGKVFLEEKGKLFLATVYIAEQFGGIERVIPKVRQMFKFWLDNQSKLFIFPGPR